MNLRASLILALPATLLGCARAPQSGAPPVTRGAQLYQQNCVPCHREDGHGVAGVYPSLAGSPVVNGEPLTLARWVLKGERPASMPAGRFPTQMLQFGWMKDADAALLLSQLRDSFGNHASPVTAATIAQARGGESPR